MRFVSVVHEDRKRESKQEPVTELGMRVHSADDKGHVALAVAPIEVSLQAELVVGFHLITDPSQRLAAVLPLVRAQPTTRVRAVRLDELLLKVANRIGSLT